jgi:hypothetical protein
METVAAIVIFLTAVLVLIAFFPAASEERVGEVVSGAPAASSAARLLQPELKIRIGFIAPAQQPAFASIWFTR